MESEVLANLGMGKEQEGSGSISQAADSTYLKETKEEMKAAEEVKELDLEEIIGELANEIRNAYQNAVDWIVDEDNKIIAIVALSGTFAAGIAGYWYLYLRKVNVNCWFCGKVSLIRASETNSWTCPYCDQFNGFTSEGKSKKTIVMRFLSRGYR